VLVTRRLRLFALSDVDPAGADIVAFQMAGSIDRIVRDVLRGGTNVLREVAGAMAFGGTTATATDTLSPATSAPA
jgi:hypothetical protein